MRVSTAASPPSCARRTGSSPSPSSPSRWPARAQRAEAEELLALLEPHARVNACFDDPWAAWGPLARGAGLLAAATGRAGAAAAHFEAAMALAASWDAPAWELRAAGDWLRSGAPVPDRPHLARRVLDLARELELPWVAVRFADAVR